MEKVSKIVLDNYEHLNGKHCETTSLRKVLNHLGCPVEEELLLGLAGGVGFINWYKKSMSVPFIGTRNGKFPFFLEKACKHLNVEMEVMMTSSPKKSLLQVEEMLMAGCPAIAYVDIGEMPYMATKGHFGQHAIVVYGVDYEKEEVYVSDRGGNPQIIPMEVYTYAHSVKTRAYPPKNALIRIKDVSKIELYSETAVKEAILDATDAMLNTPVKKFGANGIKVWAEEMKNYSKYYLHIDIIDYLLEEYINIELAGTGGKAFREMYARFLELVSKQFNNRCLGEASKKFYEQAEKWREVSKALLPNDYFGDLAELLLKKEAVLISEGNYESGEARHLLKCIADRTEYAGNYRLEIEKNLPMVSEKINECYCSELELFNELKNIIS